VSTATARWLVLASALLFSTGGAAIKTGAFGAAQVSAMRSGIAAVVLAAYLVLVRGGRLQISLGLLPAGVLYAASLTLFVAANKMTTAANAIFLQAVAPLYILVLGPWALGERWTSRDLAHVGALALGLALCFFGQQAPSLSAPDPATGNLLAALSGVTWAGTLLYLRHLGRSGADDNGGLGAVILGNAMASLVALPAAWPLPAASAGAWASVIYLGVFQIGLAYVFFHEGHSRRVGARGVSAAADRAGAQPDVDLAGARRVARRLHADWRRGDRQCNGTARAHRAAWIARS